MIVEDTAKNAAAPASSRRMIIIQLALTAVLLGLGIWYVATHVSLQAVVEALAAAHPGYVLLAIAIMLITIAIKVWRWQLLLTPSGTPSGDTPAFWPLFWATTLGQHVNLLVPFLRLGEVARVYALRQQTGISGMRAIGTLVVEKTLELIYFALTAVLLLPFIVIPPLYRPGLLLIVIPVILLALLFFLAYKPQLFVQIARWMIGRLPAHWEARLSHGLIAGLEGIAALRDRRTTVLLLLTSLVVAILAVLLPYALFLAFSIPLGVVEATLMHVAVSVASAPPSTPAKIGVFNGVAALLLLQLGLQDEAVVVSYAIVFHLVVILPQIILGSVAAWQTDWNWRTSKTARATTG